MHPTRESAPLLPALTVLMAVAATLRPATTDAAELLAAPASIVLAPSRSDALLSKPHLAYAAIGGTASGLVFEREYAARAAHASDDSPFDLGGGRGNQYGRANFLGLGTAGLWTAGHAEEYASFQSGVIAGATMGLVVGQPVAHRSPMPHLPENLYVGSKGLGLQFGF